jgi:hypothetical protein
MGLAVAWLVIGPTQAPTSADSFGIGPPTGGYYADPNLHTWCHGSGFDTALHNNALYAMNISLDSDTDVTDFFESCNHSTTDVEWLDANLPDPVRGRYSCQTMVNSTTCNHSHVILDPVELNIGINDDEDTTKTACHEAGHSVGLVHVSGGSDCMRNGELPFPDSIYYTYNDHHVSHINSAF